ncbi:glycosyltransferase [Sphingobacterium griseoflavum]|uniref:Glycosyl transferase family 28 C-terminal domain-containing protein n=1 Tax=Sphingobacterium griseoflavum TaxID=1474952 RepID=A0ABQ3HUV2_9SPHI|nr:glycosyltransferase [Sphingobacterium griseoflavum]GHE35905.1 hypothetical protein GCM10017764_19070 [Sphingobacterium griseoflavum]
MPYSFSYYVHHHGAGHITRAIAIAKELLAHDDCTITFLGTGLSAYADEIPESVNLIELPADLPTESDRYQRTESLSHLHYSPLNVAGLLNRNHMIVDHFQREPHTLCIVDVSCEVAQLARLCGIPTVVIRQHGQREDLPHQLTYESAACIIAPYAKSMSAALEEGRYDEKTLYSGGFSRFCDVAAPTVENENQLALLIGKGGTSFDAKWVNELRRQLPDHFTLHILGNLDIADSYDNLVVHGHVADPLAIIQQSAIIFCNAGHNTVMEMASLRKRMVCIPASRPFNEQNVKAEHLERLQLALVIREEQLFRTDWNDIIHQARGLDTGRWSSIMDNRALSKIANRLRQVYASFFTTPPTTTNTITYTYA